MSNRRAFLFLTLAIFAAGLHPAAGAEPDAGARERARLYQGEARAVLEKRGWHIARDESGKILADHALKLINHARIFTYELTGVVSPFVLAHTDAMFARLRLTFAAESNSRTHCAANIVAYSYKTNVEDMKKTLSQPVPFNNPDAVKEIQSIMKQAEQQMAAKHPEYAAR